MSRKSQAPKREVLPDPIYNSVAITKLINNIMIDGKKGKAQTILYNSFEIIKKETGKDPMDVFNKALDNIMPTLELKVRRIGGSNYQIPVEVTERRRRILGLR
jgi:small subunit ribosomal protein S7